MQSMHHSGHIHLLFPFGFPILSEYLCVSLLKAEQAQSMMQTKLQIEEQAILDEINRANDISPAADAALASCTNQAK